MKLADSFTGMVFSYGAPTGSAAAARGSGTTLQCTARQPTRRMRCFITYIVTVITRRVVSVKWQQKSPNLTIGLQRHLSPIWTLSNSQNNFVAWGFMARGLCAAISPLNSRHMMSRLHRCPTPGDKYIVVPEKDDQPEDIPHSTHTANQDNLPEGSERAEEYERRLRRRTCKNYTCNRPSSDPSSPSP
ncbi:hypothetical protein BDW72DRAFT_118532 [Aspergillus terricola var. indicus]